VPSTELAAKCKAYHSLAVKCWKEVAISALAQQAASNLKVIVVIPKTWEQLDSQWAFALELYDYLHTAVISMLGTIYTKKARGQSWTIVHSQYATDSMRKREAKPM
jgi:hypothetical protein